MIPNNRSNPITQVGDVQVNPIGEGFDLEEALAGRDFSPDAFGDSNDAVDAGRKLNPDTHVSGARSRGVAQNFAGRFSQVLGSK